MRELISQSLLINRCNMTRLHEAYNCFILASKDPYQSRGCWATRDRKSDLWGFTHKEMYLLQIPRSLWLGGWSYWCRARGCQGPLLLAADKAAGWLVLLKIHGLVIPSRRWEDGKQQLHPFHQKEQGPSSKLPRDFRGHPIGQNCVT